MQYDVVVVGSGNVAEELAVTVAAAPCLRLVQLFARNEERGRKVAELADTVWCGDSTRLAKADLYLLAVSDRAVKEVAESLPISPTAIVAHTAGSVSMEALESYPRRAVFYPFQGFTAGRRIDFRQVPLLLEAADEATLGELEQIARMLSERVYRANAEQRGYVHLAGVFCCNFTNAMYGLAEQFAAQAGMPYDILRPLIRETASQAIAAEHPAEVQTGPARRGDLPTQERHLQLIDDERLKKIYKTVSQLIWETSKKI